MYLVTHAFYISIWKENAEGFEFQRHSISQQALEKLGLLPIPFQKLLIYSFMCYYCMDVPECEYYIILF